MESIGELGLELVQALFDLSRTHQAMKQSAKARMVLLRARRLGQACRLEVTPPRSSGEPKPVPAPEPAGGRAIQGKAVTEVQVATAQHNQILSILTSSEYRVATLASFGYTNQEIATKLHVTPSTVEQHLTKVFRKLKVTKRTDLPVDLQLDASRVGKSVSEMRSAEQAAAKPGVRRRGAQSDTA